MIQQTYWINFKNNVIIRNNIRDVQVNKTAFDESIDEICEGIIELRESQRKRFKKLTERKIIKTEMKLEPTHLAKHKVIYKVTKYLNKDITRRVKQIFKDSNSRIPKTQKT